MKRDELQMGAVYIIQHGGGSARVRLDRIETSEGLKRFQGLGRKSPSRTAYVCTKLSTGRTIYVKSAVKFQKLSVDQKEAFYVESGVVGFKHTAECPESMDAKPCRNSECFIWGNK